MKYIQIAALVSALVLMGQHSAAAFSTEKGSDVFQGNSSNFTDPDDKQPAFLQPQGDQLTGQASQQSGESADPSVDREKLMGMSESFDHAYQHQNQ